jgi:hypothetical protein
MPKPLTTPLIVMMPGIGVNRNIVTSSDDGAKVIDFLRGGDSNIFAC